MFITRKADGAGIEDRPSIDQKAILVVAARHLDTGEPPAIERALHGKRMPLVEIADKVNVLRIRSCAEKFDRPMNAGTGRLPAGRSGWMDHIHRSICMFSCYS